MSGDGMELGQLIFVGDVTAGLLDSNTRNYFTVNISETGRPLTCPNTLLAFP